MLSVLLYSGEFLGLCRHDPERRLQYGSVKPLVFFPGQVSPFSRLPCSSFQIVSDQTADSWERFPAWYSTTAIHILCMRACHGHPSEADAELERHLAVLNACVKGGTRLSDTWDSKGCHTHQLPLWSHKSGYSSLEQSPMKLPFHWEL